jgi:hypothetical protein
MLSGTAARLYYNAPAAQWKLVAVRSTVKRGEA